MSGTSLDAVDAAMILTDGERVLDFGAVAERKYSSAERAVLQEATQAARDWNWSGPQPERLFQAAREVVTATHAEAWAQMLAEWDGPMPDLAGVHGQTVLHRRPKGEVLGATLQLIDAAAMQAALGVQLAYDKAGLDAYKKALEGATN